MGKLFKDETGQQILSALNNINATLGGSQDKIGSIVYGFHINANDSSPSNAVTYLRDAIGMTPAHMDFDNDVFNWGTWGDAFFLPKPCMVKFDGTVDYYLDEDDYTKKADGTDSDVANTSYQGNAMMEWGNGRNLIWIKFVADKNDAYSGCVYIANHKADEGFTCYPFINSNGEQVAHFYTPIYNGSNISSKLRSISGQTVCKSQNAQSEITLAKANGSGWNTEVWCDIQLINALLILMGKSLDTQSVFGLGNQSGYANDSSANYGLLNSGTMDTKGLFWGKNTSSSSDNSGVKIFGMENYWANQWRRFAGLINDNGAIKVKLCYGKADGSTIDAYNTTGEGYVNTGLTSPANGYVAKSAITKYGIYPAVTNGSSSTYYCDYHYTNNSQANYACRGGACYRGAYCGAFFLALSAPASVAYWYFGAAPSFKPLA